MNKVERKLDLCGRSDLLSFPLRQKLFDPDFQLRRYRVTNTERGIRVEINEAIDRRCGQRGETWHLLRKRATNRLIFSPIEAKIRLIAAAEVSIVHDFTSTACPSNPRNTLLTTRTGGIVTTTRKHKDNIRLYRHAVDPYLFLQVLWPLHCRCNNVSTTTPIVRPSKRERGKKNC